VRGRLTGLLASARKAGGGSRLVRFVEYALVIAIGAMLGVLFQIGLAPVHEPSASPRPGAAPVEAADRGPLDPFREGAAGPHAAPVDVAAGPDLAETTLNLVLHGTWVDEKGGAAIIKTPDDKQSRFSVGDVITSGVTLERVYPDQVVINRGGVREALRLVNRETVSRVSRAAAPAPALSPVGLASIGDLIIARPQADAVGNVRLVLHPADDTDLFEELGLRAGDALVAIENRPLTGDIAASLQALAGLEGRTSVTISVERGGVVLPITIPLPGAAGANSDQE